MNRLCSLGFFISLQWIQDFISLHGVNNCLFVTLASNKYHSLYTNINKLLIK